MTNKPKKNKYKKNKKTGSSVAWAEGPLKHARNENLTNFLKPVKKKKPN